jgi:MYXO-CTERM domain-containing protein
MRGSVCVAAAAVALAGAAASAEVIISNIDDPDTSSTLFGAGSTTVFKAAGFQMPSGDDYFLDGATLRLDIADTTSNPRVSIWTGNTNGPTSELAVLDDPVINPGLSNLTFTGDFTLEAEAIYWLYVEAEGTGNFNWISTDVQPTGLADSLGYNFNGNTSSFLNKYEITGTLVPAPAGLGLLGLGLVAVRRRR